MYDIRDSCPSFSSLRHFHPFDEMIMKCIVELGNISIHDVTMPIQVNKQTSGRSGEKDEERKAERHARFFHAATAN